MAPLRMRAVTGTQTGLANFAYTADRAVPTAKHDDQGVPLVLVKVEATALNPIDWKMIEYGLLVEEWPHAFGCDVAGTVVDAGEASEFTTGDRVWAYTPLGKPWSGSFAEYAAVPKDTLGKLPDSMTFTDAATLPLAVLTAAIGLNSHLGLSLEKAGNAGTPVLVYGASSSVGQYAVQLAKRAGCRVVAVASAKHRDWVVGTLGADMMVDYRDSDWIEQIASDGANAGMTLALDAIGSGANALCVQVLGKTAPGEKTYVSTVVPGEVPEGTEGADKCTITGLELHMAYGDHQRPALGKDVAVINKVLAAGELVPNRVRLIGGLEAVPAAMQELYDGKVSGEKLVAVP